MYIPAHQEEGEGAPGGGGFCAGNWLLMNEAPKYLCNAGEQEGDENQENQGWDVCIRQSPKYCDPKFYIPGTHPAARPSRKQHKTRQPQVHVTGKMGDHACGDQGQSTPVWDATGTQVIQADSQKIKKQPDHWLFIIMKRIEGYGECVALKIGDANS